MQYGWTARVIFLEVSTLYRSFLFVASLNSSPRILQLNEHWHSLRSEQVHQRQLKNVSSSRFSPTVIHCVILGAQYCLSWFSVDRSTWWIILRKTIFSSNKFSTGRWNFSQRDNLLQSNERPEKQYVTLFCKMNIQSAMLCNIFVMMNLIINTRKRYILFIYFNTTLSWKQLNHQRCGIQRPFFPISAKDLRFVSHDLYQSLLSFVKRKS